MNMKKIKKYFYLTFQILLEKSENDDKYIFALKSELEKLKKSGPS